MTDLLHPGQILTTAAVSASSLAFLLSVSWRVSSLFGAGFLGAWVGSGMRLNQTRARTKTRRSIVGMLILEMMWMLILMLMLNMNLDLDS